MRLKEIVLRFGIGGMTVVLSYLASVLLPWKALGGIFAAFPAVMVIAVLMMGLSQGSAKAAEIAKGAVYGMTGCAVCVIIVMLTLRATGAWWFSLILGLVGWFVSASFIYKLRARIQSKRRTRRQGRSIQGGVNP